MNDNRNENEKSVNSKSASLPEAVLWSAVCLAPQAALLDVVLSLLL